MLNISFLSSFLLLPFGSSSSYLYVWTAHFFSNYSLTPCFLLLCYTFVSLLIPVHDLTFVTLKRRPHGICNISWDMRQKHTTYWKRNWRNSKWEGGSPHCTLDIRSLRVIDERAVQLNIISKEQLLWWSCSRQGGERQCHIAQEKLHIYTYTCTIIAVIFIFFVFLFSELENLYYSFQCILISEFISF